MESNYRITVIFKDEVIRENFATREVAKKVIEELKKLFPKKFMSGALEEKRKRWEVTWILGQD